MFDSLTRLLTADSPVRAVLLVALALLLLGWMATILERGFRVRLMGRMSLRIEQAVAARAEGPEFGRVAFWRHLLLPLRAYNPSIKSVLLSLFLPSLVYALLWPISLVCCSSVGLGEHLAVQGVVFGSVFGVVLFVVGLTGPSVTQGFKRAEVVLRKTYLFPLMVGTAVSMLFTLLRGPSLLAWAATVGVLLAGVWVLYHLLSLLLGPSRIRHFGIELFKERFREATRQAVKRTINYSVAAAALQDLGDERVAVELNQLGPLSRPEHSTDVSTRAQGTVVDIDLRLIESVVDDLRRAASTEPTTATVEADPLGHLFVNEGDEGGQPVFRIFLLRTLGDELPIADAEDGTRLATVVGDLGSIGGARRERLLRTLRQAFVIRQVPAYDEVRHTLDVVVDDAREALGAGRHRQVEQTLDLYVDLAESLMQEMERLRMVDLTLHDPLFVAGGSVLDWIRSDARELITRIARDA